MEKASEKAAPQPKIRKRKANQKVKKRNRSSCATFPCSIHRLGGIPVGRGTRNNRRPPTNQVAGNKRQQHFVFPFSFWFFFFFFRGSRPPPVTTTKTTVNNDSKRSQIRSNKEKKNVKPPFSASFFFDWSFFLGTSRFNVRRPRNSVKTR